MFVADTGHNDEVALAAYVADLDRLVDDYLAAGQRAVLIADTRHTQSPPTALQRRTLGEWLQRRQDDIEQLAVQSLFIIPSPLMRGALTALGWVGVLPPRLSVVATFDAALQRAALHLRAEGLALAPALQGADAEWQALGPALPHARGRAS